MSKVDLASTFKKIRCLTKLFQCVKSRPFVLVLVGTFNTLAKRTALSSTTVTLTVFFEAFALSACAFAGRTRLNFIHFFVLFVDLFFLQIVAILA